MDANQCQVCLNYFIDHLSLQNHIETHTKRELYQCIVTLKSVLTQLSQSSQWLEAEQNIKITDPSAGQSVDKTNQQPLPRKIMSSETVTTQSEASDRELLLKNYDLTSLPLGTEGAAVSSLIQLQNERLGTIQQPQTNQDHEMEMTETNMSQALSPSALNLSQELASSYVGDMQRYVVSTTTGKAYQCDVCQRMFSAAFALRRHLMSHNNDRPDKCPICGKGFIGRQNLEVHLRVHTGEKPFACDGCGKKFSQQGSLVKHREKHCLPATTSIAGFPTEQTLNKSFEDTTSNSPRTTGEVSNGISMPPKDQEHVRVETPQMEYDPLDGSMNVSRYEEISAVSSADGESELERQHRHQVELIEGVSRDQDMNKDSLLSPLPTALVKEDQMEPLSQEGELEDCHGEYDDPSKDGEDNKMLEGLPSSYQEMVKRLVSQSKEESFSCKYCLIKCQSHDDLEEHIAKYHVGPKPYRCNICSKRFGTSFCLRRHIMLHTGEKPHRCQYCNKGFTGKQHLQNHERIHSGERPYKCQYCNKCFTQYGTLHNHMQIHMTTGAKEVDDVEMGEIQPASKPEASIPSEIDLSQMVPISVLQANPGLSNALSQYSQASVSNATAQLSTTTPGISSALAQFSQTNPAMSNAFAQFSQVLQLQMQLYTRGMENRRDGAPPTERVYQGIDGSYSPLLSHTVTGKEELTAAAAIVDKDGSLKSTPKIAGYSHDIGTSISVPTYVKDEESQSGGHPTDLSVLPSKEIEAITAGAGKRFPCEYCELQFNSPITLERHQRTHRGEKPFSCQYCEKSFTTSYCLRRHVMTHTGERPHKCDVCGKRFIEKQHLNIHYRVHTGEKPYECKFCGKRFPQGGSLYRHVQTHIAKGDDDSVLQQDTELHPSESPSMPHSNHLITKGEDVFPEDAKDLTIPMKKKRKKKIKKELLFQEGTGEPSAAYHTAYQPSYDDHPTSIVGQQDSNSAVDLSQFGVNAAHYMPEVSGVHDMTSHTGNGSQTPPVSVTPTTVDSAMPVLTEKTEGMSKEMQHLVDVIDAVAANTASPTSEKCSIKSENMYSIYDVKQPKEAVKSLGENFETLSDEVRRDYLQQQYNQLFGTTSPRTSKELAEQVSRYFGAAHENVAVSLGGNSKAYATYPNLSIYSHVSAPSSEVYPVSLSAVAQSASSTDTSTYNTAAAHYPVLATQLGEAAGQSSTAAAVVTEIYPCNICGGRYASLIDLVNHRREHSGSAELRCELCGELFGVAEHLIIHYQTHALETTPTAPQSEAHQNGHLSHSVDTTTPVHTQSNDSASTSTYLQTDPAKLANISDQEAEAAAALAMSYLNGMPPAANDRHVTVITRQDSSHYQPIDTSQSHFRAQTTAVEHEAQHGISNASDNTPVVAEHESVSKNISTLNSTTLHYTPSHVSSATSVASGSNEAEKHPSGLIPQYMESGNILSSFSELASQVMQRNMGRTLPNHTSLPLLQANPVLVLPSNPGEIQAPVPQVDEESVDIKPVSGPSMLSSAISEKKTTVKMEDGTLTQVFECEICKKQFLNKRSYYRHVRLHTGEQLCKCEICGKGFTGLFGLRRHMIIHSGQKPHECDFCGKGFIEKQHLQSHRRIHTGEKPFKCPTCGKCFTQYGTLHRHKRTHTKEKPYGCPACPKRFGENRQLTHHLKTHRQSGIDSPDDNSVQQDEEENEQVMS